MATMMNNLKLNTKNQILVLFRLNTMMVTSIMTRQDELTEEQVREEGNLVEEYLTNVTWRGEVCPQVQVGRSM